jgi:hypothetical protein
LPNNMTTSSRNWADDRPSRFSGGLTHNLNPSRPRRGKQIMHPCPGFCPSYTRTNVRKGLHSSTHGLWCHFGLRPVFTRIFNLPQVGEIGEITGPFDPHDVSRLSLTFSVNFHQPQNPGHASTTPGQRTGVEIPP